MQIILEKSEIKDWMERLLCQNFYCIKLDANNQFSRWALSTNCVTHHKFTIHSLIPNAHTVSQKQYQ